MTGSNPEPPQASPSPNNPCHQLRKRSNDPLKRPPHNVYIDSRPRRLQLSAVSTPAACNSEPVGPPQHWKQKQKLPSHSQSKEAWQRVFLCSIRSQHAPFGAFAPPPASFNPAACNFQRFRPPPPATLSLWAPHRTGSKSKSSHLIPKAKRHGSKCFCVPYGHSMHHLALSPRRLHLLPPPPATFSGFGPRRLQLSTVSDPVACNFRSRPPRTLALAIFENCQLTHELCLLVSCGELSHRSQANHRLLPPFLPSPGCGCATAAAAILPRPRELVLNSTCAPVVVVHLPQRILGGLPTWRQRRQRRQRLAVAAAAAAAAIAATAAARTPLHVRVLIYIHFLKNARFTCKLQHDRQYDHTRSDASPSLPKS